MKIKTLSMLALFIGAVALTSCSKEKKIERNLWKGSGEWNIENYDYSSSDGSSNITLNLEDCGTVLFLKDGTGVLTTTFFGSTETESMTYTNTEDELSVTSDGSTTTYDLDWEKNSIKLNRSETSTSGGTTTTETESYTLKKI